MTPCEVAVCGCGPCGMTAAILLEQQGHKVTLFERFDEPRPVGSGLLIQPTGLAVLGKLGIADTVCASGARVDRLHGTADTRTVLDVRYSALGRNGQFAVGIHRSSLFSALFDEVRRRDIVVSTGREVVATELKGAKRSVIFGDGTAEGPFDLVIDAMGARTPLSAQTWKELNFGALWTNVDWPTKSAIPTNSLTQRYRRSDVMAGVLPIGRGESEQQRAALFWSLRGDRYQDWLDRGLEKWKQDVLDLWPDLAPVVAQINDQAQLTFARYAHRTLKKPASAALVHLGDAWHSTSPQLGQGANMALLDAWALAQGFSDGSTVEQAGQLALNLRRVHVRFYQALSRVFTPIYQSNSRVLPVIRDLLVGPVSKIWPANRIQAAMVAGTFGKPLPRLSIEPYFDAS